MAKGQGADEIVASPVATGGGGALFEQHMGAVSLALLLTRAVPPILIDTLLDGVFFQTRRLGWQTDDLLLTGTRGQGTKRRLAIQVKLSFTVSASDEECQKTIAGFWEDFQNVELFNADQDALGLVVSQGTNALLGHFGALLDSAKTARNANEFVERVHTKGMLHASARKYLAAISAICTAHSATAVSDETLWRFLRVLHVWSMDLTTATRQNEAWIKTLLAQTATGPDKVASAERAWDELVRLAGEAMPNAASYRLSDLPDDLRKRHGPIDNLSGSVLTKLFEHSATTLRGIRTTIGSGVTVQRTAATTQAFEALSTTGWLLVTGPAGSGKSALAKSVTDSLAESAIRLVFRAEEFAAAHLDQALHQAQIPINTEGLTALLAGQGRKFLLIESVERLLESSIRDAFLDLLRLAERDNTWQVVMTCRDYSVETVRSAFLDQTGAKVTVYQVPSLSDEELDHVVGQLPALARPASSPFLRSLFRNPYVLDKASRMAWPPDATLPEDERSFRRKFWADIVRDDSRREGGLPQRRDDAFATLCHRRAVALEPFAPCTDLDPDALRLLEQDGLIAFSKEENALAAPSHDVLEDWAVLRWIDQQHTFHRGDVHALAAALGPYPAIRRTYRKWLGELLLLEPALGDALVQGVIADFSKSASFRDDTLVGALSAESAPAFMVRNTAWLVKEDAALLLRLIHLLRVACTATPTWAGPGARGTFFVPAGSAWAAMLKVASEQAAVLLPQHASLLVGLIVDWSKGVAWWSPYPSGSIDAVAIAHQLLPHLNNYDSDEERRQVLSVIAKLPKADETSFRTLVGRAIRREPSDRVAEPLTKLLLDGMECMSACRDEPNAIVDLARATFFAPKVKPGARITHDTDIEPCFGLSHRLHYEYFPASALRGPFMPLLQHHPDIGIALVLQLLNHAAEHYAHPTTLESPVELLLTLPDGSERRQWSSGRLWGMYRGQSVGPHVLECALMALESWLLSECENRPDTVEPWLNRLLRDSNNTAITAVVASVMVAYPKLCGELPLVLLRSREVIDLDRERRAHELFSGVKFDLGLSPAMERIYENEREESRKLRHRHEDLEMLAFRLQFTAMKSAVQEVLDAHVRRLPPADNQTEEDRVWRLSLQRMDARNYSQSTVELPTSNGNAKTTAVMFRQGEPDADLQPVIERAQTRKRQMDDDMGLFMWAVNAFERKEGSGGDWQERLKQVQGLEVPGTRDASNLWVSESPAYVAAVCVRDHWEDMSAEQRSWCADRLVDEVNWAADANDGVAYMNAGHLRAIGPAAFVLPSILTRDPDISIAANVRVALLNALTHPARAVSTSAAQGIGFFLIKKHRADGLIFLRTLTRLARTTKELHAAQQQIDFVDRDMSETTAVKARRAIRDAGVDIAQCSMSDLGEVSLDDWSGRGVIAPVLDILGSCPDDPMAIEMFARTSAHIAGEWKAEHENHRHDGNRYLEQECLVRLARFVIAQTDEVATAVCRPIIDAVDFAPRDVESFMIQLVTAADARDNPRAFWGLWRLIADGLVAFARRCETEGWSFRGEEVLNALFLRMQWKPGTQHWRHLEGHGQLLDQLFENLPPSGAAFGAYVRFLFEVGRRSLPESFVILSRRLKAADPRAAFSGTNTIFCLETILRWHVYGKPAALKDIPKLRDAVLHLLDVLVEAGSSAAYRMRDDFVTPKV